RSVATALVSPAAPKRSFVAASRSGDNRACISSLLAVKAAPDEVSQSVIAGSAPGPPASPLPPKTAHRVLALFALVPKTLARSAGLYAATLYVVPGAKPPATALFSPASAFAVE